MTEKCLIEFSLEDGQTVLIEVSEPTAINSNRTIKTGRADDLLADAKYSFDKALDVLQPISNTIVEKFKGLTIQPNEATIEFGIKLNISGNLVVAAASSEANFKVTLKWKAPS